MPATLFAAAEAVPRLCVSFGAGVDSTAMLVLMAERGIRPDDVLFADVGSERPETYDHIDRMGPWLDAAGFPPITVVRNPRPKSGDASLGDALLRTRVLPALAFGAHQCSLVWKVDPQEKHLRQKYGWSRKAQAWAEGVETVVKAIGYDNGPRDRCRAGRAHGRDSAGFRNWYPLIEWGVDREECLRVIQRAGLPVPIKSSCFFCPAMKRAEVEDLTRTHPDLLHEALSIEARAVRRGLTTVKGLGRSWSWREFLTADAAADVKDLASPILRRVEEETAALATGTPDRPQLDLFAAAAA